MQHIKHIWPTIRELADELGLPYTTVHSWDARGRIPSDHDFAIIEAAAKRGISVTLEELAAARSAGSAPKTVTHTASHANASPARQGKPLKNKAGAA